jgi:hypothetical protein
MITGHLSRDERVDVDMLIAPPGCREMKEIGGTEIDLERKSIRPGTSAATRAGKPAGRS